MTDTDTQAPPSIDVLEAEIERLNRRLEVAKQEKRQAKALHVLTVAQSYAKWLIDGGAGSTYSTFCDDFGYQPQPGEDRPALYKKIETIHDLAYAR